MAVKKKNSEEKMIDEAIMLLRVCAFCWQDPRRLNEVENALGELSKKTMPTFLKKNFMATEIGSDWMMKYGTSAVSSIGLMIYNIVQKADAKELENYNLKSMEKSKFYQTLIGGALIRLAMQKNITSESQEDNSILMTLTGMNEKQLLATSKLLAKVKSGSKMDEAINGLSVAATVSLGYMPGA